MDLWLDKKEETNMALTVDDIKKWLGSLEQKRDELRLQAHLLGMEARDEFDKVDQSIDKFRGAARRCPSRCANIFVRSNSYGTSTYPDSLIYN